MKISILAPLALLSIAGQGCAQDSAQNNLHNNIQNIAPQTQAAVPLPLSAETNASTPGCVILLHGLARTSDAMLPLSEQLRLHDFTVVNVDYPSREFPVATLAEKAIAPALANCRQAPNSGIYFVTHSLGGILVRYYLAHQKIPELQRVVMLAPPNKGSQVADNLMDLAPYNWLNGPAGRELGTDPKSLPNTLGAVDFDLGVIAGTQSINLLLSLYLTDPDDGKVSVENAKIEGMRDFISLPVSHPYIMKDKEAIAQTIYYLRHGQFLHSAPATTVITENKEF
jgi:hypothetical protein